MKNMVPGNDITTSDGRETTRKTRWPKRTRCSICNSPIWFHPIALREPVGAPEPRRSWVLCNQCHIALLKEMHRSPVRSPLRLRIAMGIVASERAPHTYGGNTHIRDQHRFLGIAWLLFIAIVLHLVAILILVAITK